MSKKAECPIHVVGETTDGKTLVDGIWEMYETYGLPLDIIFDVLIQKQSVPDWIVLYKQMLKSGMQHSRIISKLDEAIADSYGKEFRDVVISKLDQIFKPVEEKISLEEKVSSTNFVNNEDASTKCIYPKCTKLAIGGLLKLKMCKKHQPYPA
jgi:hypothetical protein